MLGCKLCFNFDLMFVLFHIVESVEVTGKNYVSENRSTWLQASRQCSLATPGIDFYNLSADIPINLITEELWVGYYLKSTAFEYIGCMTTNGIPAKLSNIDIDLQLCQSACGNVVVIGINRNTCFCFNTKPTKNIHQPACFETCGKNTVCGREGYMSLYKAVKDPEIPFTTTVKDICLKYENNPNYKKFVWGKCSEDLKTICLYGNGTVGLLNGESRSWKESVHECLRHNGLPTSLNSSRSVEENTGPVWTGIIKGLTVYKFDADFSEPPANGFGFLSKNHENTFLRFEWSLNKQLKALCKFDTPVPPGDKKLDNESTSNIGLIVGITLSLVIAVTASVVLLVLIRRGKIPHICKRNGTTSSEYVNTNTSVADMSTPRAHNNHAYDQSDETVQRKQVDCGQETQKDDSDYAHDYFVLEEDITYTEDSAYNHTGNGQSTAERENLNVYNTIESGSSYDLISHKKLNKEQKVSDKYDSLENAIAGSSNYNTTYLPDDGTYSHTKSMPNLRNNKTDNIYSIQVTDTDDQDTYNHLDSKSVVKPDQIYGTPQQ